MVGVKSVLIDGEPVYMFNSAIYIFDSASERTLEVDMIVSEITLKKYKDRESLIAEIELEDSRVINSFMFLKSIPGKLPRLNLSCGLDEGDSYEGVLTVSENDLEFPDIEVGLTLEDIRKVEMPTEKITLKLTLPIDQVEWLKSQKNRDVQRVISELLYQHMK
ncbi:hypothetical protein EJF36_18970 [Bacillus sp. HMF5848]|uniref:hypothetical protein n=1 Tax=Bacillus sp. HMF5848 TaxID=2495421 RepID=UPI000F76B1E2|nr:hypothetical protein [Bacillus sp. HMF5848]RSK28789.1 hypothetical protein EJF36_18970 [Bacillus sp. HMF5848]